MEKETVARERNKRKTAGLCTCKNPYLSSGECELVRGAERNVNELLLLLLLRFVSGLLRLGLCLRAKFVAVLSNNRRHVICNVHAKSRI